MVILYIVLRSFDRGIVQTIPFHLTGLVLAVLLLVQFTLLTGAMQAKNVAESAEIYISRQLDNATGFIGAQESRQVMNAVAEQYPIIGSFIDMDDFSGYDVTELPEIIHESITSYLTDYVWLRIGWILGMTVVACAVATLFKKKEYIPTRNRRKVSSKETMHRKRRH